MVRPKAISFLPAFLLLIISFVLLILPGSDIPKSDIFELLHFDKWVHIGMFGLLTILWCYPLLKAGIATKIIFFLIAAAVTLYGVAMEFVQEFFAVGRSFDSMDILADTIGAVLAFYWMILQLKKYKSGSI